MTTTYDPNCVTCRYSRPSDAGDHRDHVAQPQPHTSAEPVTDDACSCYIINDQRFSRACCVVHAEKGTPSRANDYRCAACGMAAFNLDAYDRCKWCRS